MKTVVFAGNYREFQCWRNEHPDNINAIYLTSYITLQGRQSYRLIYYGTYSERSDYHEVMREHRQNRIKYSGRHVSVENYISLDEEGMRNAIYDSHELIKKITKPFKKR